MPTLADKALRLDLIVEVHSALLERTESLEFDCLGDDLAYLVGVIANGGACAWPAERPIVDLLRLAFEPGHRVWQHIVID